MRSASSSARSYRLLRLAVAAAVLGGCHRGGSHHRAVAAAAGDPPEVALGERLFVETRFAQFFAANLVGNDVNAPLAAGDPVMDTVADANGGFGGPFAGESMNCRQCHLVDELDFVAGGSMRTYSDFARRSPIPDRGDGRTQTPRNSPPLVNASLGRGVPFFLHFDAEFATSDDLVRGALTGRNYGWKADEHAAAVAHIARVIREDDGSGELAAEFGGLSYPDVLAGGPDVPAEFLIPAPFRIDVTTATDDQVLDAVAALVSAYMNQLEFIRDGNGEFDGSPFDLFLKKNGLPRQPDPLESELDYARRLRGLIDALSNPIFVKKGERRFVHHDHDFVFGAEELAGLRIFLAEPAALPPSPAELAAGAIGNCIACHRPPSFTDFQFHNVGVAQAEYDEIHGSGSFAALSIPDLTTRNADPDQFLPPSAAHPAAEGVCRAVPDLADARLTDLGAWSIFGNPDVPLPQSTLRDQLCAQNGVDPLVATDDQVLGFAVAVFKTAGLRDLGHGAPYMHTGQFDQVEDVLGHYLLFSSLTRAGAVRNGDPQLAGVVLHGGDLAPLAAFLHALDEDYE